MINETSSFRRTLLQAGLYITAVVVAGTLAERATSKMCDKLGI